jgi:hypothetical protein
MSKIMSFDNVRTIFLLIESPITNQDKFRYAPRIITY